MNAEVTESAVDPAERLARVALSRLAEPGDVRMTRLVADLGARAVHEHLMEEGGSSELRDDVATRLASLDPAAELDRAERLGLRFLVPGDEEWPDQVDGLLGAGAVNVRGGVPIGLWVKGPLRLDRVARSVAIVGARSATSYGSHVAAEIAAGLSRSDTCVISGAALGIDQAAHRGALSAEGPTVAVLACGADRIYPAAHRELISWIGDHGLVVSEAPPGGAPTRVRFLARNRLIAALGAGTVVVEAALRSGALSTAAWTERLGRPLMGVPGPVTSAQSQGVHERIRLGAAHLVTCADDVAELVARAGEAIVEDRREPVRPRDRFTVRQRQVLDALPVSRGVGADIVSWGAGIGLREVQSTLVGLETGGWVLRDGHGWRLAPSDGA
ncbi:DNA-processing protein DprA [Nocardioides gilvus]|uniref:DNA-processing protein DprA n=1 Tax=Nocardioides gilvus TaxID=1735589 RepID=UPI001EF555E9|nr:DNA-processing protein DprA [Nocardioides gilvus]